MPTTVPGRTTDYRYRNRSFASSFFTVSCTSSTSTLTSLLPNCIIMISPCFTLAEAFAGFPLTDTLPASQASFATVLLFISLDTFKNLSNLMNFCTDLSVDHILQGFARFKLGCFGGRNLHNLPALRISAFSCRSIGNFKCAEAY